MAAALSGGPASAIEPAFDNALGSDIRRRFRITRAGCLSCVEAHDRLAYQRETDDMRLSRRLLK